jgi:hypothetical protein
MASTPHISREKLSLAGGEALNASVVNRNPNGLATRRE